MMPECPPSPITFSTIANMAPLALWENVYSIPHKFPATLAFCYNLLFQMASEKYLEDTDLG